MALLGTTMMTLADWAKLQDPDSTPAAVAEMLNQTNDVLMDAVWRQGNLDTGEQVSIRTGLPAIYWRQVNEFTASSKSEAAQVTETCGSMEARSIIDVKLARLGGNVDALRATEDMAFIEAMNQEFIRTLIYGNNATDPAKFLGFAGRFSTLGAGNGVNIIDCGGVTNGSQMSAWLVGWGDQSTYCIFPKGMPMGLTHQNLGETTVYKNDGSGTLKAMQAYQSLFTWDCGLVVKDWRSVVRFANIDATEVRALTQSGTNITTVSGAGTTSNFLHRFLVGLAKIPFPRRVRLALYVNRELWTALTRIAMEKSSAAVTLYSGASQFGGPMDMVSIFGVKVRLVDQLLSTEDRVI